MSIESVAIVLHHSRAKGSDKLVLLGIANHDGDGGAWPSVATLARYANVEERAVQRSLKRLEGLGEVSIHVKGGGPSGIPEWKRTNRYDVLVACPATCDRTRNHRHVPLPEAHADLWINPPSSTTPGVVHDTTPVSPTTPPPVSPTTPEPSIEPTSNSSTPETSEPQTARDPRCRVCLRPRLECEARVDVSGHEYEPDRRTA